MLNAFSPLSPRLQTGDFKLRAELQQDITKSNGNVIAGFNAFQAKHPYASASMVFES